MATKKEVELAFKGKDESVGSTVDAIQQKIRLLRKEERTSGESALKSVLKGGAGEIAETLGDALGVGAAMMGINFFAGAIKNAAQEAVRLREELASGKITAEQMSDRLAGQIPILGQVWQAGRAVRELIIGENAELQKQNAILKEASDLFAFRDQKMQEARIAGRGFAEDLRQALNELEVLKAPPEAKATVRTIQDVYEALRKEKQKYQREAGLVNDKGEPGELVTTQEQVAKERATLARLAKERDSIDAQYQQTRPLGLGVSMEERNRNASLGRELAAVNKEFEKQDALVAKLAAQLSALQSKERSLAAQYEQTRGGLVAVGAEKIRQAEAKQQEEEQKAAEKTRQQGLKDAATEKEMRDRRSRELKAISETEAENARAAARAESEAKQKQYQVEGDELAAQLERIRQYYADRIALAKTAAEKEALARAQASDQMLARQEAAKKQKADDAKLETLEKQLDDEEKSQRDEAAAAGKGTVRAILQSSRYQGFSERAQLDREAITVAKQQEKRLERIETILAQIRDLPGERTRGYLVKG